MEDNKLLDKKEKKIIQILKKEGGASGVAPLKKAVDKMDKPKGFSLKKVLDKMKNVEKHKESDYILTPINENKMSKERLQEIINDSVFDVMTEKLCPRGKAYIAARKRAGEKSSAYLSGRAVKVCKGQIKGAGGKRKKSYREGSDDAAMKKSKLGMAMYGKKAKMESNND